MSCGRLFFPLLSSVVSLVVRARYLAYNVVLYFVTFDNGARYLVLAVFNFRAFTLTQRFAATGYYVHFHFFIIW